MIQETIIRSRRRECEDSFLSTGANYAKAVESLKAHFSREGALVKVHVWELFKLITSVQSAVAGFGLARKEDDRQYRKKEVCNRLC